MPGRSLNAPGRFEIVLLPLGLDDSPPGLCGASMSREVVVP
jgi:hypothetical protein